VARCEARERRNSEFCFKLAQHRSWLLLAAPGGSPQTRPGGVTALGNRDSLFPARGALPGRVWGTLRSNAVRKALRKRTT